MAETTPNIEHLEAGIFPRLVYYEDTSDDAVESLDKFKVDIEADPATHIDALSFHGSYPEAAVALVALAKQRPNFLQAIETVENILTNNFDLEAGFDEATEQRLEVDPNHRHYRDKMQHGRGKEVQADAKRRMRINRLKFFIQSHDTGNEGPNSVPPAA